jgi:hypothetical protein
VTTFLTALISLQGTTTCLPEDWLRSQRFNNDDELMEGVKMWLSSQPADFFDTGTQTLLPRHDECLNSNNNYNEKQMKCSMYVLFAYNNFFSSLLVLLTATKGYFPNSPHKSLLH